MKALAHCPAAGLIAFGGGKERREACPYLPFSARIYLNQHHWLANRLREESIDFRRRKAAALPPLPTPARRLFDMSRLPSGSNLTLGALV
jgi:hypothetical protein